MNRLPLGLKKSHSAVNVIADNSILRFYDLLEHFLLCEQCDSYSNKIDRFMQCFMHVGAIRCIFMFQFSIHLKLSCFQKTRLTLRCQC